MSHLLEREIKLELDAQSYASLHQHLSRNGASPRLLRQENHFFDSPDRRLRKQLMSVRLRRQNQCLWLTCKHQQHRQAMVHQQEEFEYPVNHSVWQTLISGDLPLNQVLPLPDSIRAVLKDAALEHIGQFTNQRFHVDDEEHHLCLDRTTFNQDHVEYELEIESPHVEAAGDKWLPLLAAWGYTAKAQTRTKLERCMLYASKDRMAAAQ